MRGSLWVVAAVWERNAGPAVRGPDDEVAVVRLHNELAETSALAAADRVALDGKEVADPVLELEVRAVCVDGPGGWTPVAALRINLTVWLDSQVSSGVDVIKVHLLAVLQESVVVVTARGSGRYAANQTTQQAAHHGSGTDSAAGLTAASLTVGGGGGGGGPSLDKAWHHSI